MDGFDGRQFVAPSTIPGVFQCAKRMQSRVRVGQGDEGSSACHGSEGEVVVDRRVRIEIDAFDLSIHGYKISIRG